MSDPLLDSWLVQSIGWALVHFVWQGTVLGSATALTLRALAGARPTIRYAVACFSMALMLIVPVLAVLTDRASDSVTIFAAPFNVAPSMSLDRLLPSAVMVWLAGVFLLSVRLIVASLAIERLKRATKSVEATVVARVQSLAHRFGIDRPVRVFESTLVGVPTVVGYLRPVILLPASVITGLAPAYLDAVLAHELAHVRRHDYLVNALQSLVETVLFYHPAVWWCSRQIRIEREHCCDDLVVKAGGDRLAYATALAQLEELRGFEPMLSLNASGGRLVDRVRRLLGESPMRERRSMMWTTASALAVIAALVVTPARSGADASELVPSPPSESPQLNLSQLPAPRSVVRDARTVPDADWTDYVRQTQAALETLARETQGVVVVPEPPESPEPPEPPLEVQAAPQPPQPPNLGVIPVLPTLPAAPAVPAAPAPPTPPNAQATPAPPAPRARPAPPTPPRLPQEPLAFDQDSIHELMKSAQDQIAESFEQLRRALEEVGLKQEALRQAQAEAAKMKIESAAVKTQIEAMQKVLDDLHAELAKLRAK